MADCCTTSSGVQFFPSVAPVALQFFAEDTRSLRVGFPCGDGAASLALDFVPILRGIQGEKGDDGDPGPPGPPGGTTYQHDQMAAATVWTINHNLSRYPSVTVVDSAGSVVEGDLDYVNANTLIVSFSTAFAGVAYLN